MKLLPTILIPLSCFCQSVDTLSHAKAFRSNYLPSNTYGLTSNNHTYTLGFNINGTDPLEAVRIDFTTKNVLYKLVTGTVSDPSALWRNCFDSLGNLYFGFNYALRRVVKFNLKDSIWFKNLGNGFNDGQSLAYYLSLGIDKHIYGSASSGDSTFWFDYDPYNDVLNSHPGVDGQDYGLTIQGEANSVYVQTGQSPSIDYWWVRKSDNYKKKLFSIYSSSRFNIRTSSNFNYVWPAVDTLNQTYQLQDSTTTPIPTYNPFAPIGYEEVNKNGVRTVFSYFDDVKSRLYFTVNAGASYDSVDIVSPPGTPDNINLCFAADTSSTYFVGSLYGYYYKYDKPNDTLYRLGKSGYNAYSVLQWDDTTFLIGNYPDGALLKYTITRPWTVQTVSGLSLKTADRTTNPALLINYRTTAGFHHTLQILKLNNLVIGGGNVIRTANTCSIGVYDYVKDSAWGYDANKIDRLAFSSMCLWNNRIYLSTNNTYGGTPKIYKYNPATNLMEDSVSINGYTDYGKIFVNGSILYGVLPFKLYKINLQTKQVTYSYTTSYWNWNPTILPDGRMAISSAESLPTDFWDKGIVNITPAFSNIFLCHNHLILSPNGGTNIYRKKDVYSRSFDFTKVTDRILYIKYKIGL